MKRLISLAAAVVLLISALTGCTGTYDKSPDEYKNIRWITPDYSFSIYPSKDCTGTYKFNDKTYSIKIEFETSRLKARDTANSYEWFFVADWMYKNDDLYIYNIQYNTKDYKELKENYSEFYTLGKEKL